jgi:transcriptional regulator with XRE-family HTH domain
MNESENIKRILGKRLSELRKQKGLTQQELADIVGYSSFQSISNIEHGKQPIKKDMAKQFANVFNADENYFLDINTEYVNSFEEFISIAQQSQYENQLIHTIIISLAKLNGYEVVVKDLFNGESSIKELFSDIKDYMILIKDGVQFTLSVEDVNRFGNILSDKFQSDIDLIAYFKSKNTIKTVKPLEK